MIARLFVGKVAGVHAGQPVAVRADELAGGRLDGLAAQAQQHPHLAHALGTLHGQRFGFEFFHERHHAQSIAYKAILYKW